MGEGRNGDGDKRDGDPTAKRATRATRDTSAIGIRDSSRRTVGDAGLNEGAEGVPRSGKELRTGQSASPSCCVLRLTIQRNHFTPTN